MDNQNSQQNKSIITDDLSHGLYQYHIDKKNHRIARVLRVLILRNDFQDLLAYLQNHCIQKRSHKTRGRGLAFQPDFIKANKYINKFVREVMKSDYFKRRDSAFKKDFVQITNHLIIGSFLDTYAHQKSTNSFFRNTIITYEEFLNYTNVSHDLFQKEYFWDMFGSAFYNIPSKKDWSKSNPESMMAFAPPYIEGQSTGNPDPEKLCQIIIYEDAEKQEVLDYIEKNWIEIHEYLRANRPPRVEKRMSSDKTFLRDIEIYNVYQKFKIDGLKNPDIKTRRWLRENDHPGKNMEPETIRKIVSLLKCDIDTLNDDK